MMPSMGFADTVTLGVYANLNDATPITNNEVNNLNEFYVIADYTPGNGETVGLYDGCEGWKKGLSIGETEFLENGKPYAKIMI